MFVRKLSYRGAIAVCAAALAAVPLAQAGPVAGNAAVEGLSWSSEVALLQLADVRGYRHCHNMPRRTYCHKSERLPRNWAANSDTPAHNRQPCWVDKSKCLFGRHLHAHDAK